MKLTLKLLTQFLAVAGTLCILSASSFAVVYDLKADDTTLAMPDGQSVTVWGFGLTTDAVVSVPGPILTVPVGDPTLTINLTNNLAVPVSIVIPGQIAGVTPVKFADPQGRMRVSSFTTEVAPGATGVYTWNNFRPGSYIYHSGSHVQVQVQMGLYGGVKKDTAAGEAYTGVLYDNEAIMFYSEIDPALHAAVVNGTYGTAAFPNALTYNPKYFLINGMPFSGSVVTTPAEPIVDHPIDPVLDATILMRFFNASLLTHVPIIKDKYMSIVAEDGFQYTQARQLYTAQLAALKTMDAVITALPRGTHPVFDRRLDMVNALTSPGGMLAFLRSGAPVALPDPTLAADYTINEDVVLNTTLAGVDGVLVNDTNDPLFDPMTSLLAQAAGHGTVLLGLDGSFVYTPALNYNGTDTFRYRPIASDGLAGSLGLVTITINPINDAPVAKADSVTTRRNVAKTIAVRANDTDVDSLVSTATVSIASNPRFGSIVLNANGTITYTPRRNFIGTDTFTYRITDTGTPLPALTSVPGKVTIRVMR